MMFTTYLLTPVAFFVAVQWLGAFCAFVRFLPHIVKTGHVLQSLKWLFLMPFLTLGKLSAYVVGPPLAVASAIQNKDTITWPVLRWWMTHDNDFTAYQGNHPDHQWGPETGLWDRIKKRTRWLTRNKFYTGSAVLLGVHNETPRAVMHYNEDGTFFASIVGSTLHFSGIWRAKFLKIPFRVKIGWDNNNPDGSPEHMLWGTVSSGH